MPKAEPSLPQRYRIDEGRGFRLKRHDPADTAGMSIDKESARQRLRDGIERIDELQTMLYAQDRWSLLLIFQAMDAAGKDGAIKHVMSGVNPQGCQVHAFKAPSPEELDHDFLWRTARALPERGRIGIFNRSYYEEVLVVRVHPELLKAQKLPPELVGKGIWKQRYAAIRDHERHLAGNGYVIRKFFLNVSKEEQKRRFLERLEEPQKHWKFSPGDIAERRHWDDYQEAYEDAIRATAAPHAPWIVVPADQKWFTRLVVMETVIEALESIRLDYPEIDPAARRAFAQARAALEKE